jgi:heterogeneous nuclear ribonucleoprotein A1/A3
MNGNLSCKLFIGNLNYKTTEEELKKFYEKYGVVENCFISREKQTKKSKGYGFVTFIKPVSVDEAMSNRPHEIDERKVEPHRAAPKEYAAKPESHHTCNEIFIGNMKESLVEEDLKEHFSQYGTIVKVELAKDRKDPTKRKPFAFIGFDDYDPVDICCHKKYHYIKGIRLDVTKSINKKDMAQLVRKYGTARENGYGPNRQTGVGRGQGGLPYGYDYNTLEDEILDRALMDRAIARASARMDAMSLGYDDPAYRASNDGWYDRSALRNNNRGGRYLAGGRGAPKNQAGLWM